MRAPTTIELIAAVMGGIAATLTILSVLLLPLAKRVRRWGRAVDIVMGDDELGLPSMLQTVRDTATQVDVIKKEVTTNGGGSLEDAVRRLERELAEHRRNVSARLERIETQGDNGRRDRRQTDRGGR